MLELCTNGHAMASTDRMCRACGRSRASSNLTETAEAIQVYRDALNDFLADGVLEDWEVEELQRLREELGIHQSTHDQLENELRNGVVGSSLPALRLWLDDGPIRHFHLGHQCLVRLKVQNLATRPVRQIRMAIRVGDLPLQELTTHVLGPSRDEVVTSAFVSAQAGQMDLTGHITATNMKNQASYFSIRPIALVVARGSQGTGTGGQAINAPADSSVDFRDVHAKSNDCRGGVLDEKWIELGLVVASAEEVDRLVLTAQEPRPFSLSGKAASIMTEAQSALDAGNWEKAAELCGDVLLLDPDREDATRLRDFADRKAVRDRAERNAPRGQVRTVRVDASGAGEYETIGEAMADVGVGSTVVIRPGIYVEQLRMTHQVYLMGQGPNGTVVVDGGIDVTAEGGRIQGLTIRSAGDENTAALVVSNGKVEIVECDITGGNRGLGMRVSGEGASPIVRRCEIRDSWVNLLVEDRAGGEFQNCEIHGCSESDRENLVITDESADSSKEWVGVLIEAGGNPSFFGCKIRDNWGSGVCVDNAGRGFFEGCDIFDNQAWGVSVLTDGNPTVRRGRICGNDHGVLVLAGAGTFEDCDILDNRTGGVSVSDNANPTMRNCRIHDNKGDGVLVYCSGTGSFEGCDIFDNPTGGVSISDQADPIFRDCKIQGSGESFGVFINGSGRGTFEDCDVFDNQAGGVSIAGEGAPTFRNSNIHGSKEGYGASTFHEGTFEGCDIFDNQSGGVLVIDHGNPILRNCKIRNNEGDGVLVTDSSTGTFEDCDVFDNQESGVSIQKLGIPIFRNCRIHRSKDGGVNTSGAATFEGCHIFDNRNGGVSVFQHGNPTFHRCVIHDNTESAGVFVNESGTGRFESCDIFRNQEGGVLVVDQGNPTFRGCDIFDNPTGGVSVGGQGSPTFRDCRIHRSNGGVFVLGAATAIFEGCDIFDNPTLGVSITEQGASTFRNCKIHDNKGDGVFVDGSGRGIFEHCDIFDNPTGGVSIADHGAPIFRNCRIHGSKEGSGVTAHMGAGTFEGCDIFDNQVGVFVTKEGNPTIRQCRIHKNEEEGICVVSSGAGTFDSCKISNNGGGSWSISEDSVVVRRNNSG